MKNQYHLLLETSTRICSVGLSKNGKIWILKEANQRDEHASKLTLFIEEILNLAQLKMTDLSAVAVSKGPGSYTGLRIGLSTAKGICYATQLPLLGLSTLKALVRETLVYWSAPSLNQKTVYLAMLDARRMDVYAALYDERMHCLKEDHFATVSLDYLEDLQSTYNADRICLIGNAVEKLTPLLEGKEKSFIISPIQNNSAKFLAGLAEDTFNQRQFEDVAYMKPFYLKKPHITQPKSRLFK